MPDDSALLTFCFSPFLPFALSRFVLLVLRKRLTCRAARRASLAPLQLRVTGIQHPAPHLICTANRNAGGIQATAPYANTVYNGKRVYDYLEGDPQTRIWFMLYAQVLQADGASYRNVLLTHRLGITIPTPPKFGSNPQQSFNRDPRAGVTFAEGTVEGSLASLGLPFTTPLSLLAVEILPGPLSPLKIWRAPGRSTCRRWRKCGRSGHSRSRRR